MKSVLHTSYTPEEEEPLGRFEQIEILQECINSSMSSRSAACIYVSGLPGTGKVPLMHEITFAQTQPHAVPHIQLTASACQLERRGPCFGVQGSSVKPESFCS